MDNKHGKNPAMMTVQTSTAHSRNEGNDRSHCQATYSVKSN